MPVVVDISAGMTHHLKDLHVCIDKHHPQEGCRGILRSVVHSELHPQKYCTDKETEEQDKHEL